jgi:beta-lactamase regulating signal transducer with metallopeptidase domain/HEAT repeat protein
MTPDRFLTLLIEVALKGTSLLFVAALLVLLLRRGSAAHRHLVWACALAGLVALPILLMALPAWRVSAPALAWLAPRNVTVQPTAEPDVLPTVAVDDAQPSTPDALTPTPIEPMTPRTQTTSPPTAPVQRATLFPWSTAVLALWVLGAMAVLFMFAIGHVILRSLLGQARPVRDGEWHALAIEAADRLRLTLPFALLRVDGVAIPVAFGMLRPRVLLPAGSDEWPLELKRAVLLHELAHVQRHDCLTQAIAQLACALFWFHPGVWWAASRLEIEREHACDDRVLEARTRASDYADQLLGMVRSLRATRQAAWGAVAFARRSSLEGRLLAVLDPVRDRRAVGQRVVLPAALIAALLVLPFAALQPVSADSSHKGKEPKPAKQHVAENPEALRPSRVVMVPNPDQSLEQRVAWSRAAAKENVWWIGWLIETDPSHGNMLSDSEGLSLDLLGARGAFTLEDVLAGRTEGTSNPSDHPGPKEQGPNAAAMLVRMSGGAIDRVRVQSPNIPVEFRGGALFWMDRVSDAQSLAWTRDAVARTKDERLRGELVESVGFMKSSQLVTPYLMTTFRGNDTPEVRASAAKGLARHASPDVVRALASAARTDRSATVRRASVEALGQCKTKEALDALLAIAKVSEGQERRAAYDALGEEVSRQAPDDFAPTAQAVPEVKTDKKKNKEAKQVEESRNEGPPDEPSQPMAAGDIEVQRQAIESLGRYPESQSLQRLWRIAETSPNDDLRAQAVESIGRLETPASESVLHQIVWKNRQSRARHAAVDAIGRSLPADKALDELEGIARNHPSADTRRAAVEMIGRLDTPKAMQALNTVIDKGSDVDSQRQAVESLGRLDGDDIDTRLVQIARTHPSNDVRRQAVESLGRRDGNLVRLTMIAKADDVPEDVQRQAAESIGRLDDARVRGVLLELAATHPSIQVERQAVESLGRRDDDGVMGDLAQISRTHRSSEVRRQAIESMTRRDPDQALPLIEEILKKPTKKSDT